MRIKITQDSWADRIFVELYLQIFNWIPEPYKNESEFPANMPHDLRNYIESLPEDEVRKDGEHNLKSINEEKTLFFWIPREIKYSYRAMLKRNSTKSLLARLLLNHAAFRPIIIRISTIPDIWAH